MTHERIFVFPTLDSVQSVVDAVSQMVSNILYPLRELAAKPFNVTVVVDVLADLP